jgi:CheY-like chemotaxis protein
MHIIYIEDDPTNIALVERVVRMGHDTLTTYATAEDAAFNIKPGDADLILTDIDFGGGMTGLELTQRLRQREIAAPIVAISAYDLQDYMEMAHEAGGDDYMVKPVNVPDLINIFDYYRPE